MSEFKKVECTCSHGYTCRNMQDPNCCAHSCDYNDAVDHISELEREKAELVAQVEALKDWRRLALQFDGHRMQAMCVLKAVAAGSAAIYEVNEFIAKAPVSGTDHLNQIKAEAGRAGFIAGYDSCWFQHYGTRAPDHATAYSADQYSASIAKGE